MEQVYATEANELPYTPDLHIQGTIVRSPRKGRGRRIDFWMSRPCPKGVEPDDWELQQQQKWDRIWGKKEVSHANPDADH
jgi:hypothetical protein